MTTYTAWAYNTETGRTRRTQRRYHSPETARLAAEALVREAGPWEWAISPRGAAHPGDHEAGNLDGTWQLVVRPHA